MLGWGAFIDVGNGHRGLLHVDEMKWPEGAMAPSAYDCVKEDQVLEVSVLACRLHSVSWMHFTSCSQSVWSSLLLRRKRASPADLRCFCLEYRRDEQASRVPSQGLSCM